MLKSSLLFVCLVVGSVPAASAGVSVTAPANGSTVSTSVAYAASATTSCPQGIASMGIYTGPNVLVYVSNGSRLNTTVTLAPGTYETVVEAWDYCGGASIAPIRLTVTQYSGVYVSSPGNNSSVASPVNFSATATSTCPAGIASVGIYTGPYQLAYATNGSTLNYSLPLSAGKYQAVVQEWDKCGGSTATPVAITVTGNSFTNLQRSGGWAGYGQRAPNFVDCSPSPCENIAFSMDQGITSPSISGAAAKVYLGGSEAYGDTLWNNHLIGDLSSQGLPDSKRTLTPSLHDFTYDVYFWGGNLGAAEALEFDINQFFNNLGFIWGTECRIAGGNEWDIWDNINQRWVPTGVACYPTNNSWNHLTVQVQRTSNNQLLYRSITLNGNTANINRYYNPGSAPGWYGVTVNYQEDGNHSQSQYSVYLDRLTFSYE